MTGASPTVCPFVALAEDRDRRADGPDERNRCYAEPAARQRDLVHQVDFCYSSGFAACPVFLAWAARSAAEPAHVAEAARRAWGSGISAPEALASGDTGLDGDAALQPAGWWPVDGSPDRGTLPAADGGEGAIVAPADRSGGPDGDAGSEMLDWVSASAWEAAPWDERAEAEAEAAAEVDGGPGDEGAAEEAPGPPPDAPETPAPDGEALTGPKVPAALPVRRRRGLQHPIRTRGSGEWHYADPLEREPIVARRHGVAPPILLGVLGLLVVAIVVFLLPTLLSGGEGSGSAAAPSATPERSRAPGASRAPAVAATPRSSLEVSPRPSPRIRVYRVRSGDALSTIAARFGVSVQQLQCRNGILNKNLISLDQRLEIPPEDYVCPSGWRNATPAPEAS